MTAANVKKITTEEFWQEAETWLDGVANMVSHRCYQEHSMVGIRAIQRDVRKHLTWIDEALLQIELREAKSVKEN